MLLLKNPQFLPDSDPVPGVYVVNDRYVHLQGYHFIINEPLWSLLLNKMPTGRKNTLQM